MSTSLIRILIVDDKMITTIRANIEKHLDVDRGAPEIEFKSVSKFDDFYAFQGNRYDIAIFDYHDEGNNESPGIQLAKSYSQRHAESLVLLKSAHRVSQADYEKLQRRISEDPPAPGTLKLAVDILSGNDEVTWNHFLLKHITAWWRRGQTSASVHKNYEIVHASLAPNDAACIASATHYLFNTNWFAAAEDDETRKRQTRLLSLLGANLRAMCPMSPSRSNIYLRILLDDHRTWVPWELLLFEKSTDLATPISYVVPRPAREPHQPWELKRLLYVSLSGLKTEAEQQTIRETLAWVDGFELKVLPYNEYVGEPTAHPADVVHVAMHGPASPNENVSLAKLSPLMEAIARTRPSLLVLNTCHGIEMLLDKPRTPYPFPVGHLEHVLGDVDTLVTSQYPLENQKMPPIWSRAFYRALALTGDAAIAAGWARATVAQKLERFYELATVVVSRPGSPLVITGSK